MIIHKAADHYLPSGKRVARIVKPETPVEQGHRLLIQGPRTPFFVRVREVVETIGDVVLVTTGPDWAPEPAGPIQPGEVCPLCERSVDVF